MHKILDNNCWEWQGRLWANGRYGCLRIKGKSISAHRYYCTLAHGEAPPNAFCCHKCHNSLCVNPDHLYWGTAKTNYEDSKERMNTKGLSKGWGKKGHSNPRCKLTEQEYKRRNAKCKELRGQGLSYCKIKIAMGLKSHGHVKNICMKD